VNAEQTSKRTQADPTAISGKADTAGRSERSKTPSRCAGVVATACTQGQHVHKESVSRSNIRRSWCGSPITVRRWSLIAAARRTPYTALPKSSGRRGRLHRPPVSTQRPISDRILTPPHPRGCDWIGRNSCEPFFARPMRPATPIKPGAGRVPWTRAASQNGSRRHWAYSRRGRELRRRDKAEADERSQACRRGRRQCDDG